MEQCDWIGGTMNNLQIKTSTLNWFKAAGIRAIRTSAQAALAMLPAAATITEVDWKVVLSTAALAGITSLLTSVATPLPEVE